MLCLIETDDVAAGFYRRACSPGKSYGHNIKDEVDNMGKGFSMFSFKICRRCFRFFSVFRCFRDKKGFLCGHKKAERHCCHSVFLICEEF